MISVVIPCYSKPETAVQVGEQLWYTVASARSALECMNEPYEIVAVMNGEYPITAGLMHEESEVVRPIFCGKHVDSPQAARQVGIERTKGEIIFFLDAHVILPPNFFRQIMDDMAASGADFMGTGHRYLGQTFFGCHIAWDEYLWARKVCYVPPLGPGKVWKTAIHPHGAFAVRRESYQRAGGYWRALHGFGGEETQLCLKFWMMGMSCYATPNTYHWHWLPSGGRRDSTLFRDENFCRNFLLIAAAYGDEQRVQDSHDSMEMLHWGNIDIYPMMMQQVLNCPETRAERQFIAERAKHKSLAELKKFFDENDVLN